jgi:ferric-dicitrate binding protein FerR (iron transport regulator)
MEDEPKQTEPGEVLPPKDAGTGLPPNFLEYLESDKGHEIAKTILGLWKELQQVTIGSNTEQQKDQLKRNHEAWKLTLITQTALAVAVIGSAVALAWHSKMDATITGFLGVALGYVLGRKTS